MIVVCSNIFAISPNTRTTKATWVLQTHKRTLGQDLFNQTIWQQDGAKPHQANMVMDWLDSMFKERMLAKRTRRGNSWAPSSPDINLCESFLWGYLKEAVYKPLPVSLEDLKKTKSGESAGQSLR